MNSIEYKGFSLIQTPYNCHYRVFSDTGNMVMHSHADHMLTIDEACKAIDAYLNITGTIKEERHG